MRIQFWLRFQSKQAPTQKILFLDKRPGHLTVIYDIRTFVLTFITASYNFKDSLSLNKFWSYTYKYGTVI